jgi:hypothetical protein
MFAKFLLNDLQDALYEHINSGQIEAEDVVPILLALAESIKFVYQQKTNG